MNRLGGLYWVRSTRGWLRLPQSLGLFAAIIASFFRSLPGFIQLAGLLPHHPVARIDPTIRPPCTLLARLAEQVAAEQSVELLQHCYRTWLFGLALANGDDIQLNDDQLFFCAAMLHDHGLIQPTPGTDFTIDGSNRAIGCAQAAGLTTADAETIGDAICVHSTPGISVQHDGPLGFYVQAGSVADVSGIRLWDIPDKDVQAILDRYRRGPTFRKCLADKMHGEARAVPRGRFALLVRTGAAIFIRRSIHGMR